MFSPAARRFVLLALLAVVAAAIGYGTAQWRRAAEGPAAYVEKDRGPAAGFSLPDLEGKTRSLNEWRGRLVLLNFWATWCPPCREEMPLFVDMQRRFESKGLQMVGIAYDRPEAVAEFARSYKLNYPQLLGGDGLLALMGRYGNRPGSLPFSVLVGADGQVLARKLGAFERRELEELLVAHLPRPNQAAGE
jgi:peroxiredoxin